MLTNLLGYRLRHKANHTNCQLRLSYGCFPILLIRMQSQLTLKLQPRFVGYEHAQIQILVVNQAGLLTKAHLTCLSKQLFLKVSF